MLPLGPPCPSPAQQGFVFFFFCTSSKQDIRKPLRIHVAHGAFTVATSVSYLIGVELELLCRLLLTCSWIDDIGAIGNADLLADMGTCLGFGPPLGHLSIREKWPWTVQAMCPCPRSQSWLCVMKS